MREGEEREGRIIAKDESHIFQHFLRHPSPSFCESRIMTFLLVVVALLVAVFGAVFVYWEKVERMIADKLSQAISKKLGATPPAISTQAILRY